MALYYIEAKYRNVWHYFILKLNIEILWHYITLKLKTEILYGIILYCTLLSQTQKYYIT